MTTPLQKLHGIDEDQAAVPATTETQPGELRGSIQLVKFP